MGWGGTEEFQNSGCAVFEPVIPLPGVSSLGKYMNPQPVYKNIHCSFKEGINRTPFQCCKWQNVLAIWCILSVVNEDEATLLSCGGKSRPESSPPGQSCPCSVTVRTETACTGSLCAQAQMLRKHLGQYTAEPISAEGNKVAEVVVRRQPIPHPSTGQ